MYYGQIFDCDIANGPGLRVTLFVSGCTHHCKGCFNRETWDFKYGQPFNETAQNRVLNLLSRPYITGLTLLGGEPMEPDNQRGLLPLLRCVRAELPRKTIWAYSGYTYEELQRPPSRCDATQEVLEMLDVLVDGPFVEERKNITLQFRGSDNQRILDVPASLQAGHPICVSDFR